MDSAALGWDLGVPFLTRSQETPGLPIQTTLRLNSKGDSHAGNMDFILSEIGRKLLKGFNQINDMNPVIFKINLLSKPFVWATNFLGGNK